MTIQAPQIPLSTIVVTHQTHPTLQTLPREQPVNMPRLPVSPTRKGHIMADLLVDQKHLEWSETTNTIRFIAYVILAASLCLFVAWILSGWAAK
jgi:hypothetical protein